MCCRILCIYDSQMCFPSGSPPSKMVGSCVREKKHTKGSQGSLPPDATTQRFFKEIVAFVISSLEAINLLIEEKFRYLTKLNLPLSDVVKKPKSDYANKSNHALAHRLKYSVHRPKHRYSMNSIIE